MTPATPDGFPRASPPFRPPEVRLSTPTAIPHSDPLSTLYRDHHGWLSGWLRRRLGNADDAADLAQDAFMRVLKARNAAEIREPRHYLTAIAKGLVVDLFRRRSLEAEYLAALARLPEPEWPSPEVRALAVEALMEVDAMLEGLGSRVRQVFILSQCDGLTYKEIAAQTGLALRTVNKYMAAAVEHCCLYRLQRAASAE
ncbi:MAG: sigma-70 family RNA polymerase sigma factor [Rhodocyclaceae bacterium]|nr:sigma-70 family RNA polymerase sigma factor [Rhodocyclaceae bacterium]